MHDVRGEEAFEGFVEWYLNNFSPKPTGSNRILRSVGPEREYCCIDVKTHELADVRVLFPELGKLPGWELAHDDVFDDVISGVRNGDTFVTTDAGYCTLEINYPVSQNILTAVSERRKFEYFIADILRGRGILLLAYGIQPKSVGAKNLWVAGARYQVIIRSLPEVVHGVTVTAADQCHFDIYREEIVRIPNMLNALVGPALNLFANSPISQGGVDSAGCLARRELVWDFAPHRSGMPDRPFEDIRDFLRFMLSQNLFIARTAQGGYVAADQRWSFEDCLIYDKEWRRQWPFLESTIWFDARVRATTAGIVAHSTVEYRPLCTSPGVVGDASPAFVMGLIENLSEAEEIAASEEWKTWKLFRREGIYGNHSEQLDYVTCKVLECSTGGLQKRGMGEEKLLGVLWDEMAQGMNPARRALDILKTKGWDAFIESVTIKE